MNNHTITRFIWGCAALLLASVSSSFSQETWSGTPEVKPILPADSQGTSQAKFNNFAWQEFIALNWVANPNSPGNPDLSVMPSQFGMPNDTRPVVWESYKESSEVFRKDAMPPAPWGAKRALPEAFALLKTAASLKATTPLGVKGLLATSKFTGVPALDLSEFGEALTNNAWLTAQAKMNNHITLFEKRMNEDEFNYIRQNKLYNAEVQQAFALNPGIILPDGSTQFSSYGKVGAIEIKAAWIELDDESLWPQFKTSQAWVSYPTDKGTGPPTPPKLVTVGLVGLHIIHKTQKAQQFVWATFEHKRNAPSTQDIANGNLLDWYTYYNPNCGAATDYYKCQQNSEPQPGVSPLDAPVQVVRTQPISSTTINNVVALNNRVWKTIQAANKESVFLNYQLVNVLWPSVNTPITPGHRTPLPPGSPQPPNQIVANTTLETYFQNSLNCMDCHRNAPIASVSSIKKAVRMTRAAATHSMLASDYSFLFMSAKSPPKKK